MQTGILFIISAPSGCGKTSLVQALLKSIPRLCVSVSHTTRLPRPGEQSGINYHFIKPAEFELLIKAEKFLEYAKVFGFYYGTSLAWVQAQLNQGFDIILEIDWQGAQQIRTKLPEAIAIFILPPSWEALQHRLEQRGQDEPLTITKRMQQAKAEMAHYAEYDYLVVNGEFTQAVQELKTIIQAQKLHRRYQQKALNEFLQTLLN